MSDHPTDFRYVGQPRRTKEDRRFIAGQGKYVADVRLPGMKHVATVASPYPHARIRSIDASKALAMAGVSAVLTGEDLAADTRSMQHGVHLPKIQWYPLAVGVARYAGEWVAAVVADDRYIAEDAAELVEVDYEPLPAVVDPEQAFSSTDHVVHPDHG
ncbi:MAG: xanthine dehydrogenase family protein molybdopterin-binding subunit, partial [Pseudomonadota bacterium]